MRCHPITALSWQEATAHCNQLFREADRLNEIAYELLPIAARSPEDFLAFQNARTAADAKTIEGKKAWDEARALLTKCP